MPLKDQCLPKECAHSLIQLKVCGTWQCSQGPTHSQQVQRIRSPSRSHSPCPCWAVQPVQDWCWALRLCSIPLWDQVFLVKFSWSQKIPAVSKAHTDKCSEDFSSRSWPANDYSGKWYFLINTVLKMLIKRAVFWESKKNTWTLLQNY